MKPRVIIVSNRLPITIDVRQQPLAISRSMGGLATSLSAISKLYSVRWVGWAGNKRHLSHRQLANLHLPKGLLPVNIPQRLFHRYYDRLANGVLWPVLHGMPAPIKPKLTDWYAMHKAAGRFADTVMAKLAPNDLIWVHDFHLIFLISDLRKRNVHNKIGFFLHTPFPTDTHFMTIPRYKQLLRSLVQANVIGFQTQRDVDHFKTALHSAGIALPPAAHVSVFPIGIDWQQYAASGKQPGVEKHRARIQKLVEQRRVVLSVSRLDYTKGIIEQLRGFEKAIADNHLSDVMYRLVVAPSRETRLEYRKLEQQIESVVEDIHERFMRENIDAFVSFEYRNHGLEEVRAWYQRADILLVTPYADGMNLVVKEYIAAHRQHGAVVLSRTAGAASQLADAILVQPTDIDDIANGIYQAITMDPAERRRRWQSLRSTVRKHDIFAWATSFINKLLAA